MGVLSDMAARIDRSGALPGRSPIVLSDPPPCGYGPDWKKVAATAEAVRAAGIPDELNRWLTMTPAQLAASAEAVRQQVEAFRNRSTAPMKAPEPGSKSAQLRAFRAAAATPAPKPQQPRKALASPAASGNTPTQIAPPAQPAKPQETTMKKPKAAKAAKAKKTKAPKKPKAAGERARYDWAAAAVTAGTGKVPPAPDFSAPTHDRFRTLIDALIAAAKAGDAAALKAVKITPTSSTPKALDRYRGLCLVALKGK